MYDDVEIRAHVPSAMFGDITISDLIKATCEVTGVPRHRMLAKSAFAPGDLSIHRARALAFYMAARRFRFKNSMIARVAKRDHSTVGHGVDVAIKCFADGTMDRGLITAVEYVALQICEARLTRDLERRAIDIGELCAAE